VAFLHPEQIAYTLGKELSPHDLLPARLLGLSVIMLGLPLIYLGFQGIKERIQERRLRKRED
jgi:hypothetical protein